MSLDVYLHLDRPSVCDPRHAIFVRRDGSNVEITREEWDALHPGVEPVLTLVNANPDVERVFEYNITHNLNRMAVAAGIYEPLWRPDEIGITKASQLIEPLSAGLERLKADPGTYRAHNPSNGWGTYEGLVTFVEAYLAACRDYPEASVSVWR